MGAQSVGDQLITNQFRRGGVQINEVAMKAFMPQAAYLKADRTRGRVVADLDKALVWFVVLHVAVPVTNQPATPLEGDPPAQSNRGDGPTSKKTPGDQGRML